MKPEEFAARRGAELRTADERLGPVVSRAAGSAGSDPNWFRPIVAEAAQIWLEHFQAEAPGANYLAAQNRFRTRMAASLELTKKPVTVDRVVRWAATMSVNDATMTGAYAAGNRYKRWTTMHDDEVRDLHVGLDGQIRPIGGTFAVGSAKLAYPGEPVGPPEGWIECRCVAMPAARAGEAMSATTFAIGPDDIVEDEENVIVSNNIVAAADLANPDGTPYTGALVVLVPAETDPVVAASSEPAHITTVWMGEVDTLDEAARAAIAGEVRSYASALDGPVIVPVMQRGTLGDDDADVVFLERTDALASLRDGLIESSPNLQAAYDAAEQFPDWTPHVTLGYPDRPAKAEYDATEVVFDKISLWLGGEHYDYPMGGTTVTADAAIIDETDIAVEPVTEEDLPDVDDEALVEIPVHGVLAPEGVETGDGRGFRNGALTTRPLPVPLRLEVMGTHGGNTSDVVTVGRIDEAFRHEASGMMRFRGVIITTKAHANEAIESIIDGTGTGVSIDADDMTVDMAGFSEEPVEGRLETTWFSSARVAGLTIVPIPAFHEAYIALGHEFEEDLTDEDRAVAEEALAACGCDQTDITDLSLDPEANAAAQAEFEKRLATGGIVAGGQQILVGETGPEMVIPLSQVSDEVFHLMTNMTKAEVEAFAPGTKDGPGWITHPKATKQIRDYWTKPGEVGYAKIGWGTGGDFNRCRALLAKYVQNPDWLAGLCANMHKEALGFWPAQHRNAHRSALIASGGVAAPVLTLVASAEYNEYPSEWFANPGFNRITPMHIDKASGRIWGHLAAWGVCHIGIAGACVDPPKSSSKYANYLRGVVDTEKGEQRVASLTHGIGHANPSMRAAAATAHYDRTDAVFAYVNVGEDAYGIWFSGVLRPGVDAGTIDEIRAIGSLSGDWRRIGSSLDLVAAVSVNTPGYPMPSLAASGGVQMSLIAAGYVPPESSQVGTDPEEDDNEAFLARAVVKAMGLLAEEVALKERRERAAASLRAMRLAEVRAAFSERVN